MSVMIVDKRTFIDLYHFLLKPLEEFKKEDYKKLSSDKAEIMRVFIRDIFKDYSFYKYRVESFVYDIFYKNQIAYNNRYDEKIEFNLDLSESHKDISYIQALKSLRCIKYNIEEDIETLNKLIDVLKDIIIDSLEEYQQAKWG